MRTSRYERIGFQAYSPEEAAYLFSLWSVICVLEKRLNIYEFAITTDFCTAVFSTIVPSIVPIGRGVK
jgi:hypothetical protein